MVTEAKPAVRASAARDTLDYLDRFQPGLRERVWATIPAEAQQVIEAALRLSWIEVQHDHHIVDGIVKTLGRDRAIRFWADSVASTVDKPLLRAFVNGMLSLVGNDPARIIAWMPKGWGMIWRDMCTPRFELSAQGTPLLHFENIHPSIRLHENYIHSWHGAVLGFARLSRTAVNVTFSVAPDLSHATATFRLEVSAERKSHP